MAADSLSRIFSALADPTRRDMVARLAQADATVNQLAEPYPMSLQAVYKHLRVLEQAGVVTRPEGPQPRSVHLEAEVFDLMDTWIERYRRRAEERYRRLDAVLDAMRDSTERNHDGRDNTEKDGSAA
ncbi:MULTISPECIES: metalloregulator ArsR/SmtB family transcription factor [unclassified Frankia]|uniref:ArsR/SmtB family transcription factor n=1 Tax=unclassified Frankia TaxID=2632575 RepID=UPI002AD3B5C7|nr:MULTISPECIES: metalloregulator ArsR/SmtB family transcription factor [unclassified Frankia]